MKAAANPPDLETARRAQLLIKEIRAVVAERRRELLAKDLPRFVHPTFAFVAGAEQRAGMPVDIIHIKLAEKDRLAAGPMAQLFGPDWDKLRLAVHGQHVAVLLGSDLDLLDAALVNLKEGKAGLAGSKTLEGFAKLQANQAAAAFHVSVDRLLGLVNARRRVKFDGIDFFRAHGCGRGLTIGFVRADGGGQGAREESNTVNWL